MATIASTYRSADRLTTTTASIFFFRPTLPCRRPWSRSVRIRKLAHGRISRTQDDAVQLTLKFFRTENVVIAQAIMDEAQDAIDALLNEQLTK